ncbi:ATP-binding protein [uncultured Bacteroides sp.]|uniref:AAA family ATPase n=1 Tax=uncultured Bacteroides sp. TaxID=162156 RepID=UPI002AAB9364|nr:ATP-binding protein [uncultured Bacteroides sp.]
MIIRFSVCNYKVFKDETIFSFVATNYDKKTREDENVAHIESPSLRLLKNAVVYGANASGKTKLIDAFAFMRYFVVNSSKDAASSEEIDTDPFRLNTESELAPSSFELMFLIGEKLYRYGFEVTRKKVVTEWLYVQEKKRESELFYRDEDGVVSFDKKKFAAWELIVKANLVRNNVLFITTLAQFNDAVGIEIVTFFNENLKTISGLNETGYKGMILSKLVDSDYKKRVMEFLNFADLGIMDISKKEIEASFDDSDKVPQDIKKMILDDIQSQTLLTKHQAYDAEHAPVDSREFLMRKDESHGTQKFFYLTGPILESLMNGYTLVVDELDSRLHPNLVTRLISLFNSKETNPNNAQLIFNTHNSNLLDSKLLRRDQIWFVDKNMYGESKLYSLSDIKGIRKDEQFEQNYINGIYGGVPYLDDFINVRIDKTLNHENEK